MRRAFCWLLFLSACAAIAGCASVDNVGSRLNSVNANTSDALNDEALVNIIRAANYQSPNFVALSQFTGGQTETLSTTFPTASFGQLSAADKAYHLANSVSSGVSSSFESNPLMSTDFEEGILAPVSTRTLALLLNSNPREAVFYGLIESFVVKYKNFKYTYRSNPLNNLNATGTYDPECYDHERERTGPQRITAEAVCNYEKYQNLLDILMNGGLSVELQPSAKDTNSGTKDAESKTNKDADGSDDQGSSKKKGKSAASKTSSPSTEGGMSEGNFCFLPAQKSAFKFSFAEAAKEFECGKAKHGHMTINFTGIGDVEIDSITVRSLTGMINFLGQLYRDDSASKVEYRSTVDGRTFNKHGGFLTITKDLGPHCIAEAAYVSIAYCVPVGSYSTAAMIRIIQQIRNLQISPKDLNTSFSVRFTQ